MPRGLGTLGAGLNAWILLSVHSGALVRRGLRAEFSGEQAERCLRGLICLAQDGDAGGLKNIAPDELRGLSRDVRIRDARACSGEILVHDLVVVHGRVELVL